MIVNDVLKKYLKTSSSWYTGIYIKKYIKENLFVKEVKNLSIRSNRWSAYAHFNISNSVINLIDKSSSDKIFISPLLSEELYTTLNSKFDTYTLDILIEKPQVDSNRLLELCLLNSIKTVIINTIDYNYFDLIDIVEKCNQESIKVIIIIDEVFVPTNSFFELLNTISNGGVVLNLNTSIKHLEMNNVYFSFWLEDRVSSLLEYHLNKSEQNWTEILEAISYLEKDNQKKSIFNTVDSFIDKTVNGRKSFNNQKDAQDLIKSTDLTQSAIPDFMFEAGFVNNIVYPDLNTLESTLLNRQKQIREATQDLTIGMNEDDYQLQTINYNHFAKKQVILMRSRTEAFSLLKNQGFKVAYISDIINPFVEGENLDLLKGFGIIIE